MTNFLSIFIFLFSINGWAKLEKIGEDFSHQSFAGQKISDTTFIDCKFNYSSFKGAVLSNIIFIKSSLVDVDFNDSQLSYVTFEQSDIGGSKFQRAKIDHLNVRSTRAPKLSFWQAHVKGMSVSDSNLTSWDLSEALVDAISVKATQLENAYLMPARTQDFKIILSSLEKSTISRAIQVTILDTKSTQLSSGVTSDVEVVKAPTISKACLKKFPIDKPGRIKNGISVLTNGENAGAAFNACLTEMEFELKFNFDHWPQKVRDKLWLEIPVTEDPSTITSNQSLSVKESRLYIKLNEDDRRLTLKFQNRIPFGIHEFKVISGFRP